MNNLSFPLCLFFFSYYYQVSVAAHIYLMVSDYLSLSFIAPGMSSWLVCRHKSEETNSLLGGQHSHSRVGFCKRTRVCLCFTSSAPCLIYLT